MSDRWQFRIAHAIWFIAFFGALYFFLGTQVMRGEPDLFDLPHARGSDPDTSHEAAESIDISAQALRILRSYKGGDALLDYDAYRLAGYPPNARDGQRCSDLRYVNYIERTGARAQTPSGKFGHLCRVTSAGLDYLMREKYDNEKSST